MGEFLGSSQTAAYMTGPRLGGSGTPTFLPSITIAEPACKPYDTYPAPTPLRRSLTTLPWRPSAYYGSARLDPNVPNVGSMPEPRSDRNKLTELDSIKVASRRIATLLSKCTQRGIFRRIMDRIANHFPAKMHWIAGFRIYNISKISGVILRDPCRSAPGA